MKWFIFDFEVYPQWFCVVVKVKGQNNRFVLTTDNLQNGREINWLIDIMSGRNNVLVGYNIKGYDLHVLEHIISGYRKNINPSELSKSASRLSHDIMNGQVKGYPFNLCTFTDLKDDLPDWLSLKEYESNKGLAITETSVPFGKVNLTEEDKADIISYCDRDVDATEQMLEDRWNYVLTKARLSERFNLSSTNSLKRTDPSLCCDILVRNRKFDDSFLDEPITYIIPKSIDAYVRSILPLWLINLFTNYSAFDSANKEFELFDNVISVGYGGLHSVHKKNNVSENTVLYTERSEDYVLVLADAMSYYPHLLVVFDLQSRAISDKTLFPSILQERITLKPQIVGHPELKVVVNDIKLVLNATSGAMKQRFLPLYDPQNNVAMCFTGQLLLLTLCKKLYDECQAIIIQTNTDGIAIKLPYSQRRKAYGIMQEWEAITKIPLETKPIKQIWQNNVNNYVMTFEHDAPKICGAWLDHDIDPFHNIKFPIIQKAIYEYLVNGIDISRTVHSETNPMLFLYTAKRGPTFTGTVLCSKNRDVKLGKINRLYASTSNLGGLVYKVKGDRRSLMPNCPPNALTYNQEVTTLPKDLDYMWYVKEATNALLKLVRVDL